MGLFLGSNPALTPEEEKELGEGGRRRRGGFFGIAAALIPLVSPPYPTLHDFLSVSHVNPLLFCLTFLIGAEGQIMFTTSRSVEKYSLLIKQKQRDIESGFSQLALAGEYFGCRSFILHILVLAAS